MVVDIHAPEMYGRSAEVVRLRDFLGLLPASGGALVLRGEPGIGRSTLLRWASAQARARGVRVVDVTAVRDESHRPYAGLGRLVDRLPPTARTTVSEAISAGLPLGKVALALLEALGAMADERPVLVVVDDAHRLDQASWTALAFVARRLTQDPALVLMSMREGAATSVRLPGSGLSELPVEPLGAEPAREMLGKLVPDLGPDLVDQVLAQVGGNPLGLVELGAVAAERTSTVADLRLTSRLESAFARVVEGLPEPARTLVQVVALHDGSNGDEIMAAARWLDPAVSEQDLRLAVAERILEFSGGFRIGFRRPLMRSAVRQATTMDRKRHIHDGLSAVLASDPARQIWHRAGAASAPDARLAADLADAAAMAHRRGDPETATRAYELAAQLDEDLATRADLVLSAAYHAYEAGDLTTVKRLINGLADQPLPATARARCAHILRLIDHDPWSGPEPVRRYLDFVEELVRLGSFDVALDSAGFQAHNLFHADSDRATRARAVELVRRLPTPDNDPRKLCVLGLIAPLEQHTAISPEVRQQAMSLTAGPAELHLLAQAASGIGSLPAALRLASAAVVGLRTQGLLGLLAQALNLQAALANQLGNTTLADNSAADARRLAVRTGRPRWTVAADLAAAGAAALRGDTRTSQALIDSAEGALPPAGDHPVRATVRLIRGQAAMAAGDFDTAFHDLQSLFDRHAATYHPHLRFWALPFLVEAATLCGRESHLNEVVAVLAPLRGIGLPIVQLGLAYADAAMADSEADYLKALAREDLGDWPFELARLQLAYGSWLRRRRRTVDARPLLRPAANTFAVLGAMPWAARASAELRKSGERMQRGPDVRATLTAQEMQIARLAADGLSNREIAARLVLSPRTVDSHLYRSFRKLGVTSRTQLIRLLVEP